MCFDLIWAIFAPKLFFGPWPWYWRKEVDVPVIKHVEIEDVKYIEKYVEAAFVQDACCLTDCN